MIRQRMMSVGKVSKCEMISSYGCGLCYDPVYYSVEAHLRLRLEMDQVGITIISLFAGSHLHTLK